MDRMSSQGAHTQWFLARDGQQYGPLSETELGKFVDLGHLQPTDLLWREGFPDWRPAMVVFPPRKQAMPRTTPAPRPPGAFAPQAAQMRGGREQAMARQAPVQRSAGARPNQALPRQSYPEAEDGAPRGRGLKRAMVVILCVAALGGGGWYALQHSETLRKQMQVVGSRIPNGLFDTIAGLATSDRKGLGISPLRGFGVAPAELDPTLQATPLWRVLKRDYPDWYAERLKEIAALAADNKDDAAIGQQMARALVTLRRKEASQALSAGFPQLKVVASTFHENLVRLGKHSNEACYEFISMGEASPIVVSLMQNPEYTAQLQAQMLAVFDAIADGRKTPRAYPQPRKADYDGLAGLLEKRGWSKADLQLFSDEKALARTSPAKVCQLVRDWFDTQLALDDPDMQKRLLVDSLKPIVAG
jgi:GYF domain 2